MHKCSEAKDTQVFLLSSHFIENTKPIVFELLNEIKLRLLNSPYLVIFVGSWTTHGEMKRVLIQFRFFFRQFY